MLAERKQGKQPAALPLLSAQVLAAPEADSPSQSQVPCIEGDGGLPTTPMRSTLGLPSTSRK